MALDETHSFTCASYSLAVDRSDEAGQIVEACLRDCPPRTPDEHYLLGQALDDLAASCEPFGFADAAAEIRQ